MSYDGALKFAQIALDAADLGDWQVKIGNAKRQLGLCRYKDKQIVLARCLLESNDPVLIKDVILHEVAHAIAGPAAKHGRAWKKVAAALGATPKSCVSAPTLPTEPTPWVGTCPKCGATRNLYRPPRRVVACGACSKSFALERVLTWTNNGVPSLPGGAYAKELRQLERRLPQNHTKKRADAPQRPRPLWE